MWHRIFRRRSEPGRWNPVSAGTSPRVVYWWTLPVQPEKSATLGRDLLVNIIVWLALLAVLFALYAAAAG